jgi:hypothetical protein
MMIRLIPESIYSSMINWIAGLLMIGSSSFGYPSVTGNIRVPEPAAAMTPVSTFIVNPRF